MDWNFSRVARKENIPVDRKKGIDLRNFPIERARIQLVWPMLFIELVSILCYGWVLEKEASLAAPLILMCITGLTVTGSFIVLSAMLVDLYPNSPSTATAANNLVRCIMGASGTTVIAYMIEGMGRG